MLMEVQLRKITPEAAREWLEKYHGCVGHELYEFAATFAVRSGECNALPSPRKRSLSGGTEGRRLTRQTRSIMSAGSHLYNSQ